MLTKEQINEAEEASENAETLKTEMLKAATEEKISAPVPQQLSPAITNDGGEHAAGRALDFDAN